MEIWLWILLVVGATVAGMVNTLAGGGSLITVPLLMLVGLEPNVANGTNRIAVLVQSVIAAWTFHRKGLSGISLALRMMPSGLVGAGLGAYLATIVSHGLFRLVFALIMLPLAMVFFLRSKPPADQADTAGDIMANRWKVALILFPVGVYAGFVQAGVGILLLAVLTGPNRLSLRFGNAVKVGVVAGLTLMALVVFWARMELRLAEGLVLAIGSGAGGYLGSIAAIRKGEVWIRRVVFVSCVALALHLLTG